MALSDRSKTALDGVHPKLAQVIKTAAMVSPVEFQVTEGLRSLERQAQLIKEGKSSLKDPKMGRHVMGIACDIACFVGGKLTWEMKYYKQVADLIKQTATAQGVEIIWGGDWKSFVDAPHFELPLTYRP